MIDDDSCCQSKTVQSNLAAVGAADREFVYIETADFVPFMIKQNNKSAGCGNPKSSAAVCGRTRGMILGMTIDGFWLSGGRPAAGSWKIDVLF